MDPLSVTLAAISLATAAKDIVELGQKIYESFAKVSKNLQNAKRVAQNIKEMVDEIKIFCEDYKDVLANARDFFVALQGLLGKFRSFETSILPLLPKKGRRKLDLFIRGWWNNNKIQESISDLEGDIVRVMRRYMMTSAMRLEVKLEANHQDTSKGLVDVQKGMTQGFEVIRRDISALHSTTGATSTRHGLYETSGTSGHDLDSNIIMFAKSSLSTSAPMLRTPEVITEELITTAYIKIQINSIAMTVERMLKLPAPPPNSVARITIQKISWAPILEQASMNIVPLRHHVVRQVISMRDLFDTNLLQTISISESACALTELSAGLQELDMRQESILVGNWAITLARVLVDASGSERPGPLAILATYLLNQSVRYGGSGDKLRRLQTIKEAYAITENLRDRCSGEAYIQILYSDVLSECADAVDDRLSVDLARKAVLVLDWYFNIRGFALIGDVPQPTSSFLKRLFSLAPITAIMSYARALQGLGTYLLTYGNPKRAQELKLLAIAIRREMVVLHGNEHRAALAMALLSLLQGGTVTSTRYIPAEKLIDMANECEQLFLTLTEKNPLFYARKLVSVLWEKASILDSLNKDTEAITSLEEAARLAEQIVQDSEMCATALGHLSDQFRRLERHNDAVRTGRLAITTYHDGAEFQASRYLHLSRDLQRLRRYKESSEAARASVALYRRLVMRDPRKWTSRLTDGLSNLALCDAAFGSYSEAMLAWKESVGMLGIFINSNSESCAVVVDVYLNALDNHSLTSRILDDKEECLKVSSTAVKHLHRLSELHQQNKRIIRQLLWVDYWHAYNMLCVGRLQDAQQHIDHLLDVWSTKPKGIPEWEIVEWHAVMTILKAHVLDAHGCTEHALMTTQKVRNIQVLQGQDITTDQRGSFLLSDSKVSSFDLTSSMVQEARLQVNLGHSKEAIQVAEGALKLSRDNKSKLNSLMWSLHGVASIALSCRNYKRAVEAAREGCGISASLSWQAGEGECNIFIRPSLLAIFSSSEANLGRHRLALEYACLAVDASLDIRSRKSDISATIAERSYMETRGNLSEILLATGDISQARKICEERRAYFSNRVDTRMGDYRELAPILRMLGILCCSEGRHEEGEAAAQELSRIMETLGSAFPSLQDQVMIRLRHQAMVPILKVLDDMSQKLDCRHQDEVLLLS